MFAAKEMSKFGAKQSYSQKVVLNVYDLGEPGTNDFLFPIGLGLYHSGVQIGNYEEYTFASGGGIFSHPPKKAMGATFRESVDLGTYTGSSNDLHDVIEDLRTQFKGEDYNLLVKNCNCFSDELLRRIGKQGIPGYVNRLAYLGSHFQCLLPESMQSNAPVDQSNASKRSSSKSNLELFSKPGTRLGSSSSTQQNSADNDTTALLSKEERREQMRLATLKRMEATNLSENRI